MLDMARLVLGNGVAPPLVPRTLPNHGVSLAAPCISSSAAHALLCDVDSLFQAFAASSSLALLDFVRVWNILDFSFVHLLSYSNPARDAIMDYLHDIFWSWLHEKNHLIAKVAVVYAFYLTFSTQPPINELVKCYIKATPALLLMLHAFNMQCQIIGIPDVSFAYSSLVRDQAFIVTAHSKISLNSTIPAPVLQQIMRREYQEIITRNTQK
ncbi:hypothetical protein HK098_006496 [Nowakowskiella sp. JEL0407]|nr:hypothetical protein HK098_006496 [Nowakowskiella sp. JEL0407]